MSIAKKAETNNLIEDIMSKQLEKIRAECKSLYCTGASEQSVVFRFGSYLESEKVKILKIKEILKTDGYFVDVEYNRETGSEHSKDEAPTHSTKSIYELRDGILFLLSLVSDDLENEGAKYVKTKINNVIENDEKKGFSENKSGIKPDLLLHKRGVYDWNNNIVVVEFKYCDSISNYKTNQEHLYNILGDLAKLKLMKDFKFYYDHAYFVRLCRVSSNCEEIFEMPHKTDQRRRNEEEFWKQMIQRVSSTDHNED